MAASPEVSVSARRPSSRARVATTTHYTPHGRDGQGDFARERPARLLHSCAIKRTVHAMHSAPHSSSAAPSTSRGARSLATGAALQCAEAATLGMPLEVWKTRMGRFRHETTLTSFHNIYKQNGLPGFWKGLAPKMIESASKGAVLLYAKEAISDAANTAGAGKTTAGFIAGAGGGVCQTVVMGPCTFLVTAVVNGGPNTSVTSQMAKTWAEKGIVGFYPGGVAIAFRQASNWASRQGFTEAARSRLRLALYNDPSARLTKPQEAMCGFAGGMLSCWNHPFEVARIEMQSRAAAGESYQSMVQVFRNVYAQYGVEGLFKGVIPRMGLNIWQTLFMVTGANVLREVVEGRR